MSIRHKLPRLEVTEPEVFWNRRRFVEALGLTAFGMTVAAPLASCLGQSGATGGANAGDLLTPPFQRPDVFPAKRNPRFKSGRIKTSRRVAASHNNFYEFLPGRGGLVHPHTKNFEVEPWTVEVTGECAKPRTFDLDDLFKFEHEERIYRFRCVETWTMAVPWTGFPLSKLLDMVEPTSDAKFVRFESASEPEQMPGMKEAAHYPWPYSEALRMDEARHELTLLATGIYGEPLLKQHGSPVRLVCPWKYGYKNPKSIVKIELTKEQPATFWTTAAPTEYGFLSNVNPNIPHPRWSQALEYSIGGKAVRRPTRIFNGYAKFVADLYPDEPKAKMKEAPKKPR